ncbi:MAG: AraC family transcriptional regulator [Candidatus Scatosoma sp.]
MSHNIYTQADIRNPYCANIYRPPATAHRHEYFELAFVVKSKCINVINQREIAFEPNVCTLLRPDDVHYFKDVKMSAFGDYQHIDVYVSRKKMQEICEFLSPNLHQTVLNISAPIVFNLSRDAASTAVKKANFLTNSASDAEKCEPIHTSLVVLLLSVWLEERIISRSAAQSVPEWIGKLLQKTNSPDYILKPVFQIAQDFGYTPEHLSREFHKFMGLTLKQYLIQKKMERAASILTSNNAKVIDLAMMLGYQNPSNFSKNFFEVFHCSPTQYRNKYQAEPKE